MAKIKLRPGKLDLDITRGDDLAVSMLFEEGDPPAAVDVSTRTYTAQIRTSPNAATVAATFTVDMTDAAAGLIVLRLADTVTEDLLGSYVWDLEQDDGGVIRTYTGGSFVVSPDVTRA